MRQGREPRRGVDGAVGGKPAQPRDGLIGCRGQANGQCGGRVHDQQPLHDPVLRRKPLAQQRRDAGWVVKKLRQSRYRGPPHPGVGVGGEGDEHFDALAHHVRGLGVVRLVAVVVDADVVTAVDGFGADADQQLDDLRRVRGCGVARQFEQNGTVAVVHRVTSPWW
jgi:hypothetical protein